MHDADSAPEPFLAELVALRQQHAALAAALADQQRAERESDARFRDLIEGSIQGIVIHRNFIPLFANQAYATILDMRARMLFSRWALYCRSFLRLSGPGWRATC